MCPDSTLQGDRPNADGEARDSAGFTPGIMGVSESVDSVGFSSLGFLCGFASVGQAVQEGMEAVGWHGTIPRNDFDQDFGRKCST